MGKGDARVRAMLLRCAAVSARLGVWAPLLLLAWLRLEGVRPGASISALSGKRCRADVPDLRGVLRRDLLSMSAAEMGDWCPPGLPRRCSPSLLDMAS